MSNWFTIVSREYITRVRRRAFILSTVLGPVLMVGFIALIVVFTKSQERNEKILVLDPVELLSYTHHEKDVQVPYCPDCFPERDFLEYRFTKEDTITKKGFLASEYTGMIEFDESILQNAKAHLFYETAQSAKARSAIKRDLSDAVEKLRVRQELNLDYETYKKLKVDIGLKTINIQTRDENAENRSLVGWIFSMFIFMFIMIYGMHVMRGVIEEKSNRIVEVVVSIVKPETLMGAKITGIGLVGLTQILVWIILSVLLYLLFGFYAEHSGLLLDLMAESGKSVAATDLNTFMLANDELGLKFLTEIPWLKLFGWGVFFYIGGFALYASMLAAVGASVEQESDAQYLLLPVMLPLTFSYLLNIQILDSPDSTLATVCLLVPFTSPFTNMIQISMNGDSIWTVVSATILFITVILMIKLASRIYRTGIFMYGKKPTLKEIFKWLTYKNK